MPKHYPFLIPLRLLGYLLITLLFTPAVYAAYALRLYRLHAELVRMFYAGACICFSIRVTVKGRLDRARPLLVVSNHFTYLDVPVLGSVAPVRFTPKSEVSTWPVISWYCNMARCIYIDRRISQTGNNHSKLIEAVREGSLISLFPEGTTNDGTRLLPFRSSFFSLADEPHHVKVQPVAISYTHINGKPIQTEWLPLIGWYADMEFFPHFRDFLSLLSVRAEVVFLPALEIDGNRKDYAKAAEEAVAKSLEQKKAPGTFVAGAIS